MKFVRVALQRNDKIDVLNHIQKETLSIDKDFHPAENVNVLISTLVML